jgi:hypothetical protein
VRLLIRSDQPADLREAWRQLREDWATTVERVRSMPAGSEHRGVDGEWSMVETLRHLVFVHDSWFRRCVLGLTDSFTAMGLAPRFVPYQEQQGLDRSARPSLEGDPSGWSGGNRLVGSWWPKLPASVRTLTVVVAGELVQTVPEVAFAEDQHPVGRFRTAVSTNLSP